MDFYDFFTAILFAMTEKSNLP